MTSILRRTIITGKDIINMSIKESKRLQVIHQAIDKSITQKTAAEILNLSERQIRRLVKGVRQEGAIGVVHKNRGRPSNRRTPEKIKNKIIKLYQKKYHDFGPLLASEKLIELDGIKVSDETLRTWLLEAGLWKKKRKRKKHRQWRQRKECFGQMIQMDGSHHDWLEGRGPELVVMGYIDDATSNVFVRFYDYEGTMPAMDSFKLYIRRYGLPQSVYLDKHSTYKSPKELSSEAELGGHPQPMSQFERALKELGVEVIHANSPQAKGRVERLFGTLQDRPIKEMRLKGIKTKEAANEFVKGYLPGYNKRFRVGAANETDVHMKLERYFDLDEYLCIKKDRTVRNDNTISFEGKLYQIEEKVKTKKVTVEKRLNGSLGVTSAGVKLKSREITERPQKEAEAPKSRVRKAYTPAKDHPWRRASRRSNPASCQSSSQ